MAALSNFFKLATRQHYPFRGTSAAIKSSRAFSLSAPNWNDQHIYQNPEEDIDGDVDDLAPGGNFQSLAGILIEGAETANVEATGLEHVKTQEFSRGRGSTVETRYYTPISSQGFLTPADFSYRARSSRPKRKANYELGPSAEESKARDVFHQLGIDPLHEATNSRLLSNFVSKMGKIRTRAETGLTWKSQRRLGKAIRRARMMGIIPVFSKRILNTTYSAESR